MSYDASVVQAKEEGIGSHRRQQCTAKRQWVSLTIWHPMVGVFFIHRTYIPMKILVRLFFKTLRALLGPFMLLWEMVSRPKGIVRAPALQAQVDQQCSSLALYQFQTCPFCIKVRQEMCRLSLNIERRDAQKNEKNRADLIQGFGQPKVPCLKITDTAGNVQWLVESGAIIAYLRGRFSTV
jgi:glutaredoxin